MLPEHKYTLTNFITIKTMFIEHLSVHKFYFSNFTVITKQTSTILNFHRNCQLCTRLKVEQSFRRSSSRFKRISISVRWQIVKAEVGGCAGAGYGTLGSRSEEREGVTSAVAEYVNALRQCSLSPQKLETRNLVATRQRFLLRFIWNRFLTLLAVSSIGTVPVCKTFRVGIVLR